MSDDVSYMQRALELAERGRYSVSPNPMVGCVVVRDGQILGEGWHERAGEAHAEVAALRNAGEAKRATLYVTLEPCSHQGRTPPCAEAVIASGVTRVVVAMRDPNELVDGEGIARLRRAGLDVTVGVLEGDAQRLNERFVYSVTQQRPFVLLKAGMTLDGKLATVSRDSQWITSVEARERSLTLREEYDAILVGGGTVKADDPRLTRRLGLASHATPWTRIVLDSAGEVPPHAQILRDGHPTILFSSAPPADLPDSVVAIPIDGQADLGHVLTELHQRGIRSLLVEGGALVHSEFIRHGLWQKMILFIAPMVVGGGSSPAIFSGEPVSRLTDAHRFRFHRSEFVGGDLMLTAYR